jgi:hypothetical protein
LIAKRLSTVRHLNSKRFLSRYLIDEQKEPETSEVPELIENNDIETDKSSQKNEAEETSTVTVEKSPAEPGKSQTTEGELSEGTAVVSAASDSTATAEVINIEPNGVAQEDFPEDESMDSEDRSVSQWTPPTSEMGDYEVEPDVEEEESQYRYEIAHPFYHIRTAEALWSPEERKNSPEWIELLDLLEKFFTKSPHALEAWQRKELNYSLSALHLAAYGGITDLVDLLLAQGADIAELHDNQPLLITCAGLEDPLPILQYLLEHGANPNTFDKETNAIPAFHYWMMVEPSLRIVKQFLRPDIPHTASCTIVDGMDRNVMTYFSIFGSDPAALRYLIECGGDINLQNSRGQTPMHHLLRRREIPLPLLEAYIECGADVNVEDNDSERKLYLAMLCTFQTKG